MTLSSRGLEMPGNDIDILAIDRGTVTARAGCGKTHLIAEALTHHADAKPILVLTHTNAGVVALRSRHPRAVESIDSWADANRHDAAIWTALGSNFHEADKAGEPFSVEAAIRYLEARDVPTLDRALAYIRQAPVKVQTPLRAAVTARWPEG